MSSIETQNEAVFAMEAITLTENADAKPEPIKEPDTFTIEDLEANVAKLEKSLIIPHPPL